MLEKYIRRLFGAHGQFCAEHPLGIFVVGALFCVVMMVGMVRIRVEQSPVSLWVEPQSRTNKDMTFFNDAFNPFFRIEEVVLSSTDNVVTNEAVLQSFAFHEKLLSTPDPVSGVKLEDICWKPLKNKGCLIQNWLNYFQESNATVHRLINTSVAESAEMWMYNCVSAPVSQPCFSALGLPTEPITVFGSGSLSEEDKTYRAEATLMTYLIENSNDEQYVAAVRSWEKNVFLKLAAEWSDNQSATTDDDDEAGSGFRVSYMAQRSIEDALVDEESNYTSVVVSYIVMFCYIAVALGYFSKVHSKAQAALLGIFIVMVSVGASIGFCSTLDVPLTLIIIDVIPFLLVAIGVDNMFIISNEFWFRCRVQMRSLPAGQPLNQTHISQAMREALGEVGGTIFLAGASEGLAFSLGALTSMPAVRAFCLYSGVAILVNLALQVTVFVAFLTLDARRAAAGRFDLAPCCRHSLDPRTIAEQNPMAEEGDDDPDRSLVQSPLEASVPSYQGTRFSQLSPAKIREANSVEAVSDMQLHKERVRDEGFYSFARLIRHFLRKYYVHILFKRPVQIAVTLFFIVTSFCVLFLVSPEVELGLRPTDPIPDRFYLRQTLLAIEDYLQVGPLIYFASPAPSQPLVNFSDPAVIPAMDSLFSALRHDTAYVEPSTVASWFDDFRYWLCYYSQGTSAMAGRNFTVGDGCIDLPKLGVSVEQAQMDLQCHGKAQTIPVSWFVPAVKQFLTTPRCCYESGTNTGICGFQYDQEVIVGRAYVAEDGNMYSVPSAMQYASEGTFEYVTASRIRAQTVRLSTNEDYIASLSSAYNATETLNEQPQFTTAGISLFPYSIYFVFYSQYLDLPTSAGKQLLLALGAVAVVTFLVLSSVSSTLSIVLCIVLILIDLTAIMHWWSIDINAISVVNMVMCVGISVEFCAHIAVAFCGTKGPIRRRMMAAMVDMGSNVVCGITLTKLLGVSILAFSPSKVFRKYYFHMYASMVVLGALHGLLFLPCLLLLVGASFRQKRYKWATL